MRQTKVDIVKQSRPRTLLPRPTVFKDKTKFDRAKIKQFIRKDKEDC